MDKYSQSTVPCHPNGSRTIAPNPNHNHNPNGGGGGGGGGGGLSGHPPKHIR